MDRFAFIALLLVMIPLIAGPTGCEGIDNTFIWRMELLVTTCDVPKGDTDGTDVTVQFEEGGPAYYTDLGWDERERGRTDHYDFTFLFDLALPEP